MPAELVVDLDALLLGSIGGLSGEEVDEALNGCLRPCLRYFSVPFPVLRHTPVVEFQFGYREYVPVFIRLGIHGVLCHVSCSPFVDLRLSVGGCGPAWCLECILECLSGWCGSAMSSLSVLVLILVDSVGVAFVIPHALRHLLEHHAGGVTAENMEREDESHPGCLDGR